MIRKENWTETDAFTKQSFLMETQTADKSTQTVRTVPIDTMKASKFPTNRKIGGVHSALKPIKILMCKRQNAAHNFGSNCMENIS